MHNVKVALYGLGDKTVLATDQRLRETGETIEKLQRWFPQLQVSIEENEKAWRCVGHNIQTVAEQAQQVYNSEHANRYMLDQLHAAGVCVRPPTGEHGLHAERSRAMSELRAFNERIRELRKLHTECVGALKEKEYYHAKVEAMRVNEGRRKKVTEREVDRRLRNEMKLSEMEMHVRYRWQRLGEEVGEVEDGTERVLELVLLAFARTQDYMFSRNPMRPTLAVFHRSEGPVRGAVGQDEEAHRRTACEEVDGLAAPPPSESSERVRRRHQSAGPRLFSKVSGKAGGARASVEESG